MKMEVRVDNHSFAISKLDKIFWPEQGYTKGDLIGYYQEVSPYIIKYLDNRPVVFTRYPDGVEGKYFYQKNAPSYLPSWIPTFSYYSQDSQRTIQYILVGESSVLLWLANQACIEMHPWLSPINRLDHPDYLVIDLDPSAANSFGEIVDMAFIIKKVLDELGLRTYPKTSGSQGLHIYLPLQGIYTYHQVRKFAQAVASLAAQIRPELSTVERSISKRGAKIYLDYLQNAKGQTLCSPYSLRAGPRALVSAPLRWEELEQVSPADFNLKNMLPRLKEVGDLFAPVLEDRQTLDQACTKLGLEQLIR